MSLGNQELTQGQACDPEPQCHLESVGIREPLLPPLH